MSEQKVWVEKMPKNCADCPCVSDGKDKWQILKEFVIKRIYFAGYDIQEHGSRVLTDILYKMCELEAEDVED